MTGVGDTLYEWDENHRVYRKDESGRVLGGPIYREHFRPLVVVGEEKRSWIVSRDGSPANARKISKNRLYSAAEVDEACWVQENGIRLADLVARCHDAGKLRKIAEILGYERGEE